MITSACRADLIEASSTQCQEQASFQVGSFELKLCVIFLHILLPTTHPASNDKIGSILTGLLIRVSDDK
jgi:hypothetical protein